MENLPHSVSQSRLFARLLEDEELTSQLKAMRSVVVALAQTTGRTVPDFTDHTARHMDALWLVADRVLTVDETNSLNAAEAFLLGCGFYLHDIGMAYAATEAGLEQIKQSAPYASFIGSFPAERRKDPKIEARAIASSVRRLHADAAKSLAINSVPGSTLYIFESQTFREAWGLTCGEIAASHHWSISALENTFGPQGEAPLPGGRRGDLLYVAACLRVIDFAHINRDRAPTIDRAFRFGIDQESLVHWYAQENIDGPERAENDLTYRAAKPIADVEAWWLYFGMLHGLDEEIRAVRRMLDQRKHGFKRISLQGVRGASSPEEAAAFIPTDGFLPIEVNLRTGSIERLVELLAGETLYGPNPMAAVRELIQNARDAVLLKTEIASTDADRASLSIPIRVSLNTKATPATLEIVDHGIGMTQRVMTDYLISLASDYWTSQFAIDFPSVAARNFKNAGRFGIGFLSVFMLGPDVTVESNRSGGERSRLSLRGLGRRGELRQSAPPPGSGTAVRVKLKAKALEGISPLDKHVAIYAPTLPHAISVDVDGNRTELPMGWLNNLETDDFYTWVNDALRLMRKRNFPRVSDGEDVWSEQIHTHYISRRYSWFHRQHDSSSWSHKRPEYVKNSTRLLASFIGTSLLCLRGLAVQPVPTPGFLGVIDLDAAAVDVSRSRAANADISSVLEAARQTMRPQIVANLNELGKDKLLIDKTSFIANCSALYGLEVILESDLPWISQLKLPGNVEMICSADMLARVETLKSVFLIYNSGPWTAMKRWAASEIPQGEMAFLVDGEEQARPSYRGSSEGVATGQLASIWDNYGESPLFMIAIGLISQAWQVSPSDLTAQSSWMHESEFVFVRLVRP